MCVGILVENLTEVTVGGVMGATPVNAWQPQVITRFIRTFGSSTRPALVDTDTGEGYLKAMGNPAGPHALACELVGSMLARRLGLRTFYFSIIQVTGDDEIPLNGHKAMPGPSFISRRESGQVWGGKDRQLKMLANPKDVARLVLFDTWTRNCDRHVASSPPRIHRDNVWFSEEGAPAGKFLLKAIDHTHCFDSIPDLSHRLASIDRVQDERIYGLFPEFKPFVMQADMRNAVADLLAISRHDIAAIVQAIPAEWQVDKAARDALVELTTSRAVFVGERIMRQIWPQDEFDFDHPEEEAP